MQPKDKQPAPHSEVFAGEDRRRRQEEASLPLTPDLFGIIETVVAEVKASLDASEFAAGQAQRLEQGVAIRGGPAMPGTYYPGFEHSVMKDMVNTNMDPGQVDDTGAAWNSLGNTLVEFGTAVSGAVGQSRTDWSGAAAERAHSYFTGVGDWMGGTGQAFQLAANRMNAQSEAAATARSGMPEPVNFSMADAIN